MKLLSEGSDESAVELRIEYPNYLQLHKPCKRSFL